MEDLDESGVYEHLGVPTGFQKQPSAGDTIRSLLSDLDKIDKSLLAPWQKLDAVNTYVLSRLAFHLKAGAVPKKPLTQLDNKLKQLGKKWLHLPQRASAEVLYLRHQWGGMNLLPTNVIADVSQAVHGLRLLTSPDVTTARLARASLEEVVRKKLLRNPTTEEIAAFLTGATEGDFQRDSGDISSAWTRLRSATRRLRSKLDVCWKSQGQDLVLQLHGVNLHRQQAEGVLKDGVRHFYLSRLLAKPDQGKVSDVTTLASASNHFMRGGNYTRFAEWRFIHRARLGVVPLNGCRRFGGGDKRCRRCGAANETLPHVLNHCPPHLVTMTRRHNAVLDRLTRAMNKSGSKEIYSNQPLPNYEGSERPDLVVVDRDERTVFILDVTIPFENRYTAFEIARNTKIQKYQNLAAHFERQGFRTSVDAFVIGSLGGYDPANESALRHLGISHGYAVLMKRLMVSDTIRWSRDIYVEHITGHRQYQ